MTPAANHLLQLLPRKDRTELLAVCQRVEMTFAEVLGEPGQPARHVYFPLDSFISLIALNDGKPSLEVGMVGSEGMVGEQLILGELSAPFHTVVQGPGWAWRIATGKFLPLMKRNPALQNILRRYLSVRLAQLSNLAVCVRFHQIDTRLARWLLMSQDRAQSDHFHVTHEGMATMLGVRRVGVTLAASELQDCGLIRYHRGELTVLDRTALEGRSCSCYATDRALHRTLFPAQPA